MSDRLLTQEQFADLAGVTQPAISQMIAKGRLAIHKGGLIDPNHPLSVDYIMRHPSQRRRAERLRKAEIDEQAEEETDDDLFTAADVEELLRKAFICDSANIECALDTYSHLKLGAKIAKAARSAKDMPSAVKTVERAVNAFLKMYAKEIKVDGDCFIKAWREDDLGYYMNGPSNEELAVARKESAAARPKKRPRGPTVREKSKTPQPAAKE
jgi:predicted transcriptional regulator